MSYISPGDQESLIKEALRRQQGGVLDSLANAIARRLRAEPCTHGCPYRVRSDRPYPQYQNRRVTFRPLCDACVLEAVRKVLTGAV
jgi:hypothetical protein